MTEDELEKLINRLQSIYDLLTGKPDPEQEEDAQKELIGLFELIQENLQDRPELVEDANTLYEIIVNWDTLESWFNEVEDLGNKMKEFLEKFGKVQEPPLPAEEPEPVTTQSEASTPQSAEAPASSLEDEYKRKMQEMEAKMAALEEKERSLQEKEEQLQKSQQDSAVSTAPNTSEGQKTTPKPKSALKPKLQSKLSAPMIEIPKILTPKKKISPSTQKKEVPIPEEPAHVEPEKPKIKINLTGGTPIKIQPTSQAIKINVQDSAPKPAFRPKIRPVSADNVPKSNEPVQNVNSQQVPAFKPAQSEPQKPKIQIKPVGGSQPSIRPVGGQQPGIRPVGGSQPSIRPVGGSQPSIRPVGGSQPSIRPVGGSQPSIRPVGGSQPGIRPVGAQQPRIKPVGGSQPSIRSVGSQQPSMRPVGGQQPGIRPVSNSGMNSSSDPSTSSAFNAGPKKPVNLFDQKVGDKKPMNLFDQSARTPQSQSVQNVSGVSSAPQNGSGPVQKVDGLNRMNFAAQKPQVMTDDNSKLANLPPNELYLELIRLEAKQYYYNQQLTQLKEKFQKGGMDEGFFRGEEGRNNFEIDNLTKKIKTIRAMIIGV